jgi:hypothetical protein
MVQAGGYLAGVLHCLRMSESMLRTHLVCREKQANGTWRSTQCTDSSDPVTSTSELLLRQNSVTAHAH